MKFLVSILFLSLLCNFGSSLTVKEFVAKVVRENGPLLLKLAGTLSSLIDAIEANPEKASEIFFASVALVVESANILEETAENLAQELIKDLGNIGSLSHEEQQHKLASLGTHLILLRFHEDRPKLLAQANEKLGAGSNLAKEFNADIEKPLQSFDKLPNASKWAYTHLQLYLSRFIAALKPTKDTALAYLNKLLK